MSKADGLFRLVCVAFRKYSRDPQTRAYSARHLLSCSIALCAEHNDLGAVALITAETLAELKRQDRLAERSVG